MLADKSAALEAQDNCIQTTETNGGGGAGPGAGVNREAVLAELQGGWLTSRWTQPGQISVSSNMLLRVDEEELVVPGHARLEGGAPQGQIGGLQVSVEHVHKGGLVQQQLGFRMEESVSRAPQHQECCWESLPSVGALKGLLLRRHLRSVQEGIWVERRADP